MGLCGLNNAGMHVRERTLHHAQYITISPSHTWAGLLHLSPGSTMQQRVMLLNDQSVPTMEHYLEVDPISATFWPGSYEAFHVPASI